MFEKFQVQRQFKFTWSIVNLMMMQLKNLTYKTTMKCSNAKFVAQNLRIRKFFETLNTPYFLTFRNKIFKFTLLRICIIISQQITITLLF